MHAPRILVMGLPGSGKTTFAHELAALLAAVHFNADDIRKNVNKGLGFSIEDRIEQARRMGHLASLVSKAGHYSVCDFVCPTAQTRLAFNPTHIIWMNTIKRGMFEDTNALFEPPTEREGFYLHTIASREPGQAATVADMILKSG